MSYDSTTHGLVTMRAADLIEASSAAYFGPADRQANHLIRLDDRFRLIAAALGYRVERIAPAELEAAE